MILMGTHARQRLGLGAPVDTPFLHHRTFVLRIHAFGELVVLRDGRRVPGALRTPGRQALLALLAGHSTAGVSRSRTRQLLGIAPKEAGNGASWEDELAALQDILGEEHLHVTDDSWLLDAEAASTDVWEFRAALASGDAERAVLLQEGRLLEGFHYREAIEFDRWLQTQRDSLASESAAALERLAEEAMRRGEPLAAVRWWRMLAAQYPLNDRIAASLMEALVAAGDREGALRHARFHEALLAERLDIPADEQVLALARSLRSGAPAGAEQRAGVVATPDSSMQPDVTNPISRFAAAMAERYVIEREIGRGGNGLVLLAQDVRHERSVAIKLLHPELVPVLGTDRFRQEIRLIASLQHPNILPLFDSGSAAGTFYYVMPFIDGESLRQRLINEGQLPIAEALAITRETASGLASAHARGIVHRDIKPENILLREGRAVVADFGIARSLEGATERLTEAGTALGTPAYMSPEQAYPDATVDGRSDIYALGCVLYEMLAGHPPFVGGSSRSILARHAADGIPSLRTVRPSVPAALERAVETALAKSPADRYPTADAFWSALENAVREGATPPSRVRTTFGWTLAIAVALLLITALALLLVQPNGVAAGTPVDPVKITSPSVEEVRR